MTELSHADKFSWIVQMTNKGDDNEQIKIYLQNKRMQVYKNGRRLDYSVYISIWWKR